MARPVRQLSLQQPAAPRHHPLRRQLSEEHPLLRVTASSLGGASAKEPQPTHRPQLVRPRPVKLAWGDPRPNHQRVQPVEVVATRCTGNQRKAATIKPGHTASVLGLDKDAVMYTRQQLAERLRKAWKERERSRPNLNIILSHVTCEDNLNSPTTPVNRPPSSPLPCAAQASKKASSSPVPDIRNSISVVVRPASGVCKTSSVTTESKAWQRSMTGCDAIPETAIMTRNPLDFAGERQDQRIAVDVCVYPRPNTAMIKSSITNNGPQSYREMSASTKRVTFKNSSTKAVFSSFNSEPTAPAAAPTPPPLLRALSAPSHRKLAVVPVRTKPSPEEGEEEEEEGSKNKWKSKPTNNRRRARHRAEEPHLIADKNEKPPSRRGIHRGSDVVTMVSLMSPSGSDTEEVPIENFFSSQSASPWFEERILGVQVSGNINTSVEKTAAVTNVSVSNISTKIAASTLVTTDVTTTVTPAQVMPLKRSAVKSVCFQKQPDNAKRSCDPAPARTSPVVTPSTSEQQPAPPDSGGTSVHREDVAETGQPAAVTASPEPTSTRSRSPVTVAPEQLEEPRAAEPASLCTPADGKSAAPCGEMGPASEPVFSSPKEKECWHLYKKMMDKGVCVSFETILRGMLTPTEYRLLRSAQLPEANPNLLTMCNAGK